ncbi:MAG TPA: dephospho-CoA kinase [Verrucomicrobiae bacterium]|nr:dephospho-CoA kinase [Verrucomicrobiae bacterium]
MKTFGITGGIGMGKSTAGQILQSRGVPVVDTDILARKIVEPGAPALGEITRAFGRELLSEKGELRRDALAQIVFSDPAARQKLEAILHPRIRELWRQEFADWRAAEKTVAVVVIPLLFETAAESELDKTICVACSETTQRRRLLARGWTPAQIAQRVAAQWPVEKKMAKADYVVWTEGEMEILGEQLHRIMESS